MSGMTQRNTSPVASGIRPVALPDRVREAGVEAWQADVREIATDNLDESALDWAERARADAFLSPGDRDEYVVAHLVLRELLGAHLGRPPRTLGFRRAPCPACGGPHGRPELDLDPVPIEFSLSHGGGQVLVALAGRAVGVDVEALSTAETAASLTPSLPPAERAAVSARPTPERPAAFARAWARLEAYLKALGTGIAVDLGGVDLARAQAAGWTIADLDVGPGLAAAVALSPTI